MNNLMIAINSICSENLASTNDPLFERDLSYGDGVVSISEYLYGCELCA